MNNSSPANQQVQMDMFQCDITNFSIKENIQTMELPIFSLSKNKDLEIRQYRRGNKVIRVIPSSVGAATVFDKDLLLYVASQIVEAQNQGKQISRHIIVDSNDFLRQTSRGDGRANFERILNMLRRLKGTIIETNVPSGEQEQINGFGILEDYSILSEKSRKDRAAKSGEVTRVLRFSIILSEWLFNGLRSYEVLTLDRQYFKLTRPIERRLYELARKHCGDQALWKINIDLLGEKLGTRISRTKIRDELRQVIRTDVLPEYRIALDRSVKPDNVVFYTRNSAKLSKELIRQGLKMSAWFSKLERSDNTAKKQPAIGDV